MTSIFRGIPNLISVDRRLAIPLYQQIYQSFRARITAHDIRAGELIPSSRELAKMLRVSRLPVLNAYAQLLAEGYLETRAGAGTYVAQSLPGARTSSTPSVAPARSRSVSKDAARLPRYERPTWAASLGPFQVGQPDLHLFPIESWLRLVARYSRSMRVKALQYGDPMGRSDLRGALATYLRTSRGVRCESEQIMIVSGAQQALDLTTRVLLNAGDAVWLEDPGYWLVRRAIEARGCRAIPVSMDAQGLSVDVGRKRAPSARAAFVAPSHQYPLGVTMSASRRLQLLEWAAHARAWIVEDDYDSEFRYDSSPIASLQGLDQHARVIYVGTLSKIMFPSLRLGYVVIPRDLIERFCAMRETMDICPADLTQAVAAEFIREGHFARHIRRMRPIYAERRDVLVEAIEKEIGQAAQIVGDAAGMHLAVLIDGLRTDKKIAEEAVARSLWLSPLSPLYYGKSPRQGFVLGFGNTRAAQIKSGIEKLAVFLDGRRVEAE